MATLFHFPEFSRAPNKLFSTQKQPWQLPSRALSYPWRRASGIRASSSYRRPRNSRKVKSDEELCSEIKQFVSLIGLPEGHIPSMKMLSDHGRKDLANIVRRRGYRVIKELLATSSRVDNNGLHGEKCISENHGLDENGSKPIRIAISEVPLSIHVTVAHESLNGGLNSDDQSSMKKSTANSSVEQGEMDNTIRLQDRALAYNETDEQHSIKESREHSPEEENNLDGPSIQATCPFKCTALGKSSSWSQHGIGDLHIGNHKFDSMETIIILSLEEKVGKFMQNDQSGEGDQEVAITMKNEDTTHSKMSSVKEKICGTALTPKRTLVSSIMPPESVEHASQSHSAIEGEQMRSYDGENYLSTKAREESQFELDHLRSMLHQELELSHMREQIENEKNALSALQTKAEAEIRRVQTLISEKDAELDAVEESLSGLKEVNIQYAGEGEIVEVTGSLNGWRHRIKLDHHQPFYPATDSIGSRKSRLWSTKLWLYPGKYEIKFIVDGHWKIDPQRESVYTRNGICNNILRVDK